jgi:hypothetical protein
MLLQEGEWMTTTDFAFLLWKFREFTIRNATQWTLGSNHHNPIWAEVAEALDSVGMNNTTPPRRRVIMHECEHCKTIMPTSTEPCPICSTVGNYQKIPGASDWYCGHCNTKLIHQFEICEDCFPKPGAPVDGNPDYLTCRVCGCTDDDCSGCIERTGKACSWARNEPDELPICTACDKLVELPLDVAYRMLAACKWLFTEDGKARIITKDDRHFHLCRTDKNNDVRTWIKHTSDPDYTVDPVKYMLDKMQYGARLEHGCFYVIDAESDG